MKKLLLIMSSIVMTLVLASCGTMNTWNNGSTTSSSTNNDNLTPVEDNYDDVSDDVKNETEQLNDGALEELMAE